MEHPASSIQHPVSERSDKISSIGAQRQITTVHNGQQTTDQGSQDHEA